jgi:flavodoxin
MNLLDLGKIIGIIIVIIIIAAGILFWRMTIETATPMRTINPQSSGPRAIVVYSPGISDFSQRMAESFASGLASANWSVDIVTASSQAPSDLTDYSMLVISGPIYMGQPSKPIQNYMTRMSDLKGLRVYVLLTGVGDSTNAENFASNWITPHGGVEAGKLTLYTLAPNTPVDNSSDPPQIATKTAQSIPK